MAIYHQCFGDRAVPVLKALGLDSVSMIRSVTLRFACDEMTSVVVERLANVDEIAKLTGELDVLTDKYQLVKVENDECSDA